MCHMQGSTIDTVNKRLPLRSYLTPPRFNDDKKHGVKEIIKAFEDLNNTSQKLRSCFIPSRKLTTPPSQLAQSSKPLNKLTITQRDQTCAPPVQKEESQNSAEKTFTYPLLVSGLDSELRSPALVLDMIKKLSSTINEDNKDDEYFDDEYYGNEIMSRNTMQKILSIEEEIVDVNAELHLIEHALNKLKIKNPESDNFKKNFDSSHIKEIQNCTNPVSKDKLNSFNLLQSGNYKFIY